MQIALDKVVTWAEQWCVTINREKTTGTLFTLSPKIQPGRLTLDDKPLKIEAQQTYLGVTFDKRMTWKQHITSAEAMARRKMNIMRKLAGTKWGANEKILKSVYQGNVRPHLEYGSSSWMTAANSPSDLRQILSSEPGTMNHHRCYEVNTNTKYGRDYEHTTITYEKEMQSHDIGHQISVLSRPSNEYKIKTTFLRQTQEIELCIRDKSLTKKTPGSFTKVCQTHSFHTE